MSSQVEKIKMDRLALIQALFPQGYPKIWCPPLTHYGVNGEIDFPRIDQQIRFLSPYVQAFLIPGSTGDGWELSFDEYKAILVHFFEEYQDDQEIEILVGLLRTDPTEVQRCINFAIKLIEKKLGYHIKAKEYSPCRFKGFVLCPPKGKDLSQAAIQAKMEPILQRGYPMVVYQLPQITENEMSPDLVEYFMQTYPNCYMLKDSSGNDHIALAKRDFHGLILLRGAEGNYAQMSKLMGGPYDGFLLSTANSFPIQLHQFTQLIQEGNITQAAQLSDRLSKVITDVFEIAKTIPVGNAFTNANKLIDHFNAFGTSWKKAAYPRLHAGDTLSKDLLQRVKEILETFNYFPTHKYMHQPLHDVKKMDPLSSKLKISESALKQINDFLLNPENPLIQQFLAVVKKYGTPAEINQKAVEARKVENLLQRLKEHKSPYVKDLEWLIAQRDQKVFIKLDDYYKKILGLKYTKTKFLHDYAVTMEISALQYFPFLIEEIKQVIARQELMPGRIIRVRKMKEQEQDNDLLAVAAAMNILGISYVETLDTKGVDGSNVHLGGPATITGYFGGVGQPNDYPLKWLDEFLYYYTNYGVRQVLNVNSGTILLAYMLYKLGIDIEFKISVFMGNDNPYSIFWTLLTAKLFSRPDGTTPLIGFNFSNSVNNTTIELCAIPRKAFGFEDIVRFEHHITETWKSIVRQPYNRRDELVEVAATVKNISAKHEGGEIETEQARSHPSDILDYFIPKTDVLQQKLMDAMLQNYLDKHDSVVLTANALIRKGIPVIVARNIH